MAKAIGYILYTYMNVDTRNIIVTIAGIGITLVGARYVHASLSEIDTTHVAVQAALREELDASQEIVRNLQAEIAAQEARQLELEQQLVAALEAAGQKEQADAAAAKLAEDQATARREANQQATLAKDAADAQAAAAAQEAASAKALADAQAKALADAQAKAQAAADAKALADAQAAQENATKPSRRTSAS